MEDQLALPDAPPRAHMDGETYDPVQDYERLNTLLARVYTALCSRDHSSDGWWTLRQLANVTGGTEASVSARLRDLRKPKFGKFVIERERVEGGLFRYRLAGRGVREGNRE